MKEGFDVGLEMSGNPAALPRHARQHGPRREIALLGLPEEPFAIDWNTVIFDKLTIKGIYGREMYETWYMMTVMLQSGLDIAPVITHRFPSDRFEEAFAAMAAGESRQGDPGLERRCRDERDRPAGARSRARGDPRRGARQAGAGADVAAGRARRRARPRGRGPQLLREQLPRPGRPSRGRRGRARRRSTSGATAWPRCASSAARRRSTSELEAALERVPRHGGHDPLLVVLRRERRPVRDAARRGGRDHLRRAEPREHHRRRPALQGAAVPLQQQRHGRPRGAAEGGAGRAASS